MLNAPSPLPILRPPHDGRGRPGRAMIRLCLAVGLSIATMAGTSGPALASDQPQPDGSTEADGPSIHYLEALAHADDPNLFTPGDAVTIPFRPRSDTDYQVDGVAPVALPAGRASGRSMAASSQGSVAAVADVVMPASPAATTGKAVPGSSSNVLRREIFGFLPYWESSYTPNYDIVSTIAYFGVGMDGSGNLIKKDADGSNSTGWGGWTSSWMTKIINDAHANGRRVVITIQSFAWSTSGAATQTTLLSSPTNRANGIAQIVAAITDRGADGVNLDFEPIASGQTANFTTFVHELRVALDAAHPGYELTYDATGRGSTYDNVGLLSPDAADAVFIMGYDFRSIHEAYAASMDPLTSPLIFDLTDSIERYKAWAPDSKIILGLPYYGRKYVTSSNALYATTTYTASNITFTQANPYMVRFGRNYDAVEQSAWTAFYDAGTWQQIYYDDAQALAAREDMINYWNLRGMGIWVLGYDAGLDDAANVLASRFLTDKTPPKVGIVNMSPLQRDEGFAVTWTGYDDWNGIRDYDVQVSVDGGPFSAWLTATTATTSKYQGTTGHSYAFRVRATDGAGNVGPWDVTATYTAQPTLAVGSFGTVQVATLSERSSPTASGGIVATASQGTVLQVLAGPVSADGFTWYQVTGPFAQLNSVTPLFPGPWVAATDGTTDFLLATTPPNSTAVTAGISGLSVGLPGQTPDGTGIDRGKVFSPDGDGIHDTLPVSWENNREFDSVGIRVFNLDGSLAGSINLGNQAQGQQSFAWNGMVDGASARVADGQYLLQISATDDGVTYRSPSEEPFVAAQWTSFGAYVETAPSGAYFPIEPARVLDTRGNKGLTGPLVEGEARSLAVAGLNGVPANAIAVSGNLTVTQATANGFVQMGPTTTGGSSTLNLKTRDDRANGVTLGLASDGSLSLLFVCSTHGARVQAIFDLTGYFVADPNGATFVALPAPARLVDTRIAKGVGARLTSGKAASFQVAGAIGVPANAIAVTGNATVTGSTGRGYITLAPSIPAGTVPRTSTLNFTSGDERANNILVPLGGGSLQVEYVGPSRTTAQFVFDVTGYFVPGLSGATFVPVQPGRVVDSRISQGFKGPLKIGGSATFTVSGEKEIRPVAVAVVGNLTVTGQTSRGWLSVGPVRMTTTSTLNFPTGDNRANGFVSSFGPGGTLTVTYGGGRSSSTVQVVVDVLGYYR
jgi:spore germination protein YaaH